LLKSFSFFEVPEEVAGKVVNSFRGMYMEDRKLIVQLAQDAVSPVREKKKFFENDYGKKVKRGK